MTRKHGPHVFLGVFADLLPQGEGKPKSTRHLPCYLCGAPSSGLWCQGHPQGGLIIGLCHEHAPRLRPDDGTQAATLPSP